MLDLIVLWIILVIILVLLSLLIRFSQNRISKIQESNKKSAEQYGRNIISGIVAGGVVLLLGEAGSLIYKALPILRTSSVNESILSGVTTLLVILVLLALAYASTSFLFYQGMKFYETKNPKKKS